MTRPLQRHGRRTFVADARSSLVAALATAVVVFGCGTSPSSLGQGVAGGTTSFGGAPGVAASGGAAGVPGPGSAGGGTASGAAATAGAMAAGDAQGNTGLLGPVITESACSGEPISVLFLIDRSGSMNCNLPPVTASADCEQMSPPAKVDATAPSKWEVIAKTLSDSLDALVPKDSTIVVRAGVSYFSVDGVCGATSTPSVPVDTVTPAQLDKIRTDVGRQKPHGGTPIVGATVLGYKYLYQALGVNGNAHVILLTDGADSCAGYYASNPSIGVGDQVTRLISTEAPQAQNLGIKTWVIGAPGSEPSRYTLSALAIAGGTRRSMDCSPGDPSDPSSGDCHYDMTKGDFQTGLKTALDHIMAVVTCQVR